MIQIQDLVKIYNKGDNQVQALNGINCTLPDTGLVFVLGKSGCGKSTLLNMLGGLDDLTSGDILFNGTSLAHLSEEELNNYRSNFVGIIYQNFNLFNNDTVYQNVLIASKLENKDHIEKDIDDILESLMLTEKKNALVKNLSGGQKQRVAIARALIKESQIILADEPTGNLDSKNTAIIFDILKEVAKERLVVVVSHDNKSALQYADRILYLSDGNIYDDKSYNIEFVETDNKIIEIPEDAELEEEEIDRINSSISSHNIELRKNNKRFLSTGEIEIKEKEKPDLSVRKKNITSPLDISFKFLKSTMSSFVVTIIILSVIIALLAFAKNFILFDESKAISVVNEEYNAKAYILNKSYSYYNDPLDVNKTFLVETNENDKKIFKDAGYTGNIYELYNMPINCSKIEASVQESSASPEEFYSQFGKGVAIVDKNYLTKIFDKIDVVAGSLYGLENSDKIIITDYFADSLLYYDKKSASGAYISDDEHDPYQKILNVLIKDRYVVGAIINTGYKEKYKDLLDIYNRLEEEPQNASNILQELKENNLLNEFLMQVDNSLNIAYSINPNFKEAILDAPNTYYFAVSNNLAIYDKKSNLLGSYTGLYMFRETSTYDLSKGEIMLSTDVYNEIFNSILTAEDTSAFEKHDITLNFKKYSEDSLDSGGLTLNVSVVGVFDSKKSGGNHIYFSFEDYKTVKDNLFFSYALIFDDVSQCYNVNKTAKMNYFYSNTTAYSAIFTICDIIDVFEEIFIFIFIVLIAIAAIILISHSLRVVKKNQYLIGVYKSLGYTSSTFMVSSILDSLYLNVIVYAFSLVLSFATNTLINKVLTDSFAKMLSFPLIKSMTLVGFSFPLISVYIGVVFGVTVLSLLAPILKIRKLKPNLILSKAVE